MDNYMIKDEVVFSLKDNKGQVIYERTVNEDSELCAIEQRFLMSLTLNSYLKTK